MFSVFFALHIIGLRPLHPPLPHRLFVPYVPFVPFVPSVLLVPRERSLVLTNTVVQWRASMTWGHDDDDNMRIWGRRYEDLMVMVWRYDHVMMKSGLNQYRGRPPPSLTFVSLPNFARLYRWWWSASPVFVFVFVFGSIFAKVFHHQKFDEVIINLGICNEKDASGMDIDIWAKWQWSKMFIAIIVKHRGC